MTDPLYGGRPEDGLHILKDVWKQKEFLGLQAKALGDNDALAIAIKATLAAAPVRKQGFRLDRSSTEFIHESEQERRLEAPLMTRWCRAGMWPIPGGW